MDHWIGGILILLFGTLLFIEAERIPKAIRLRFWGYAERGGATTFDTTVTKLISAAIITYGLYSLITG